MRGIIKWLDRISDHITSYLRAMGIILLGYRGSGKTTIGRLLGERLSWPVIDTDARIVAMAGMTIREIFEHHGEVKFREYETIAVRDACSTNSIVIALGGGAILRPENRETLMKSSHERIYLRCDAHVLHDRIHADPLTAHNRPSLTHLGGSLAEIEHLLAEREPLYRSVKTHELDVTHLLPEAAAAAIVAMLP